jgi:hypothetical protein
MSKPQSCVPIYCCSKCIRCLAEVRVNSKSTEGPRRYLFLGLKLETCAHFRAETPGVRVQIGEHEIGE